MATPRHARRGYAEVLAAALINGAIGTMVTYATMPASMLVALRMFFGAAALGVVVAWRRDWQSLFKRGARLRLLIAGVALAVNLLSYFIAIRATGVAVAIFLSYLAPVYVALVAPRLIGGHTERVVFVALGVALAGMALILVPGLAGEGMRLTAKGLFFAVVAGVTYAVYLVVGKQLRDRQVEGTTIVFSMCVIAVVLLTPLGIAQSAAADFNGRNLLMAALLGVITTALSFSLIMDGMHHIPVQHASIMGYLEPVSAPIYALVLLSQVPSAWTVAGGALIIAAGVIVMRFGVAEQEMLA
jgi:drug/metabolite transporter (DMT)-like permease